MSRRNPPLYCTLIYIINRHAGTPNKAQTKGTMSLDYSSLYYIGSRIGWVMMSMKEIFKSWMDVEMILGNCPITIPTVHSYKYYSDYGVPGRNQGNFTVVSIRSMICDR